MSGFGSGLKNSARVTWAARNTSGRSLIPLSTRSTSLMTGSYSTSTSRTMPKRSPVRKCWVRVPWTMLHLYNNQKFIFKQKFLYRKIFKNISDILYMKSKRRLDLMVSDIALSQRKCRVRVPQASFSS